jgi:8-oxo-dGTP pyrophosphatase MutT (NUDIX family)
MKNYTLIFLIKKEENKITEICLAMKKRGLGVDKWNGAGGKPKEGESFEDCAIRETKEEIGVDIKDFYQVSEMYFKTNNSTDWNEQVKAYFCEKWIGEVTESEEMNPKWFNVSDIPYSMMWPEAVTWLPKALEGKIQECRFVYDDKDQLLSHEIKEI